MAQLEDTEESTDGGGADEARRSGRFGVGFGSKDRRFCVRASVMPSCPRCFILNKGREMVCLHQERHRLLTFGWYFRVLCAFKLPFECSSASPCVLTPLPAFNNFSYDEIKKIFHTLCVYNVVSDHFNTKVSSLC